MTSTVKMFEKKPLISVVIPVYQVENYIQNSLKSVVEQTFTDYEIIIVDDGSTDRSIEIAKEILQRSEKNFKIIHQQNSGQGIARNKGVEMSSGEWIYFMDSDDIIQPWTFEMMQNTVQQQNVDIVFTEFQYVNEETCFKSAEVKKEVALFNNAEMMQGFLDRTIIPLVPGTLYKSTFLKNNHIEHKKIRWSEDQFFMWCVLNKVSQAAFLKTITYNYVRHPNSIMTSTQLDKIISAYEEFKHLPELITLHSVKKYIIPRWVWGNLHAIAKRHDFTIWKEAMVKLEFRRHVRTLISYPGVKLRVTAALGFVSPYILYVIMEIF